MENIIQHSQNTLPSTSPKENRPYGSEEGGWKYKKEDGKTIQLRMGWTGVLLLHPTATLDRTKTPVGDANDLRNTSFPHLYPNNAFTMPSDVFSRNFSSQNYRSHRNQLVSVDGPRLIAARRNRRPGARRSQPKEPRKKARRAGSDGADFCPRDPANSE